MIHLLFGGIAGVHSVVLGPAPWFSIGENFIRQGPAGDVVAHYRNHVWEAHGRQFVRYDCKDRSLINFENAIGEKSENFGPFNDFWVSDGAMYTETKLFAKHMDETQLWHCYETDTYWAWLLIKSAA